MIFTSQDGKIVHDMSGGDWKPHMADDALVERVGVDGKVEVMTAAEMRKRMKEERHSNP